MGAEHPLHRHRLGLVAERGARAMGVDVLDAVGREPGIRERQRHRSRRTTPLLVGLRDVAGVAAGPIAHQLTIDPSASATGMLELLKDHHTGSLGKHETIALGVERPTGPLRIVGPERQGAHVLKTGQAHRRQRRLAPSSDHHIGIAVLDRTESTADRVAGTGTRGGHGEVRPLDAVHARDMPAAGVHHQLGDGERGDFVDALRQQPLVLRLELRQATDPGADHDAAAIWILEGEVDPRVGHGIGGRCHGELRETIKATQVLGTCDPLLLRLPGNLASELDLETTHVK